MMTGIINSNPQILGGKPIITGTRIPVKCIFDLLGQGFSIDEIIEEYPSLSKDMIKKIIEIGREVQDSLSETIINFATFQEI